MPSFPGRQEKKRKIILNKKISNKENHCKTHSSYVKGRRASSKVKEIIFLPTNKLKSYLIFNFLNIIARFLKNCLDNFFTLRLSARRGRAHCTACTIPARSAFGIAFQCGLVVVCFTGRRQAFSCVIPCLYIV